MAEMNTNQIRYVGKALFKLADATEAISELRGMFHKDSSEFKMMSTAIHQVIGAYETVRTVSISDQSKTIKATF